MENGGKHAFAAQCSGGAGRKIFLFVGMVQWVGLGTLWGEPEYFLLAWLLAECSGWAAEVGNGVKYPFAAQCRGGAGRKYSYGGSILWLGLGMLRGVLRIFFVGVEAQWLGCGSRKWRETPLCGMVQRWCWEKIFLCGGAALWLGLGTLCWALGIFFVGVAAQCSGWAGEVGK